MKNRETVRPMTEGQKRDLIKTFSESLPEISFVDADAVLANKGPFVTDIRSVVEKYLPNSLSSRQLAAWQKIYRDLFGIEIGPIPIPTHRKGFDRLLVVAQGVTIEKAYAVCAKLFPCWRSTDKNLDEAVPTNDRTPTTGTYAVWVRDRIEADEELKNLSADALAAKNIQTETILERILHEPVYFLETRKHLDTRNVTLGAGSRGSFGHVPHADWCDDDGFRVDVDWYHPVFAGDDLRAREVVS